MSAVSAWSDLLRRVPLRLLFSVVLVSGSGGDLALGQHEEPSRVVGSESEFCQSNSASRTADVHGLAAVYCIGPGPATTALHGAHVTARSVFYGAVPSAWLGAALTRDREAAAAAYRLSLTQGLTYGATVGLKFAVSRPRPYVDWPLEARAERHRGFVGRDSRLSFPSGHASLSVALATSWSLSYPRWYVIAPGTLWATGVTLSRVHLGVHYPSDVLAGAVLGAAVALFVHELRDVLTPGRLQPQGTDGPSPAVPITVRLRF